LGNGTLSVPSLKFAGDLNTGIFLPSSSNLAVVVANTQVGDFSSTGLSLPGTLIAVGGVIGGTF